MAEGCVERMTDGEGKMVAVTNPGCNHMQTPRVGYDMPGQGKAAMEFMMCTPLHIAAFMSDSNGMKEKMVRQSYGSQTKEKKRNLWRLTSS
mgnify:CR=1 FL=1